MEIKDCVIEYNVDGVRLSSMKTGGAVKRVCRPENAAAFASALKTLADSGEKFMVLGFGSNVLFTSGGYDGTVLTAEKLCDITDFEDGFTCGAGVSLSSAASHAAKRGLAGLEFAYGIPGSVGGGLYMNAGAYGGQMSDAVLSALVCNGAGDTFTINRDEMKPGYRHSVFMEKPYYILSVSFKLPRGDGETIRKKMTEHMESRRKSQPLEYPSCGSTFKRPKGHYAGALIEGAGLKGAAIGGAQVSEKHAGFIINRGGATGDDVAALIRHVQATVKEKTGVSLETEVFIVES